MSLTIVGLLLSCCVGYPLFVLAKRASLANQCRAASANEDWDELELAARQWTYWQPNSVDPWMRAAEAAMRQGKLSEAANYLVQLPNSAPVDAFHELARIQLEYLNQPQAAARTCERTLKLFPADTQTHQRLISYYAMTCQRDRLVAEAKRAIEVGCESLATYAYLVGGKWLTLANGHAVNNRWLESDPDNELFAVAAQIHLIANREQIEPLSSADTDQVHVPMVRYGEQVLALLTRFPQNVELIACRGNQLCQEGLIEELAELLTSIPPSNANESRFWRFKGWYHMAQQQWPEARAAYERALQLWPYDWVSQHELASALRSSDSLENAKLMQQRASMGKEVMKLILAAPNFDASMRDTFECVVAYMRVCGEHDTADALMRRLEVESK